MSFGKNKQAKKENNNIIRTSVSEQNEIILNPSRHAEKNADDFVFITETAKVMLTSQDQSCWFQE